MGPVVTINSATLVNKGLEVIEAHLLFGIPFDRIEVVVHPTSVVHSMVEFTDGSTLAQASPPTMLIPIALGLAWPDRVPDTAPAVDWTSRADLGVLPARRRGVPRRTPGPRGGGAGRHRAGGLQRRQRGVRRGVPRRAACRSSTSSTRWPRCSTAPRRTLWHGDLTVDDVLAADAWARAQTADRSWRNHSMTALTYTARRAAVRSSGVAVSIGLHELGHLIPGKLFNVKVTQFFVGFGRTLWSRQRGETEYGVKAIPLGGYCKLVGMVPPDPDDPDPARPRPQPQHRHVRAAGQRRPRRRVRARRPGTTTTGSSTTSRGGSA